MSTETLLEVFEAIGKERTRRLCGAHVFRFETTGLTGTTYRCTKCPLGITEGALMAMQEDAMDIIAPCPATLEHVKLANSLISFHFSWRQTGKVKAE